MVYCGTVWVKVSAALVMVVTTGTMRLGSVMELVSCVVLPLSVVTVGLAVNVGCSGEFDRDRLRQSMKR